MQRVRVLDTHTAGEPTRVVIAGGPDLGTGPIVELRERFRRDFDKFRSAIVKEPRGSDVMVGALLVPPHEPGCVAGVIFFNNVGYLGMCGHGAIGVAVALGHLRRIDAGQFGLHTPVGPIHLEYDGHHCASLNNVPSYRHLVGVIVDVPGFGSVIGDVAYGGNWFFLVREHPFRLEVRHIDELTDFTRRIRQALTQQGITGAEGAEIDHIELYGPPVDPTNHSRNFVLCPGMAYDRSPCGTGTSAKLACLAADGKLAPAEIWRQESILGTVFEGSYESSSDHIRPRIKGSAFVIAESELLLDPSDPLCWGVRQ